MGEKRARRWGIRRSEDELMPVPEQVPAYCRSRVVLSGGVWRDRTRTLRVIATASRPPVVVSRPAPRCELEYGVKCRFCGTTQWGFGTAHAARSGAKAHLHIKG